MLKRSFFERPADQVARDLLGKILVRKVRKQVIKSRILEVEAYCGVEDKACHASKGRTPRTEIMFGPAGRAYVYFIYGMYEMFNIVTEKEGKAHAVLIRGLEPFGNSLFLPKDLSGPGKLTRALHICRKLNGVDLCTSSELYVEEGVRPQKILKSKRIGVEYAGSYWKNRLLRFQISQKR